MGKIWWLLRGAVGNDAAERLFDARVADLGASEGADLRLMAGPLPRPDEEGVSVFIRGEPSMFQRVPGALKHVGFFTWPADRLPVERNWESDLHLMDELWVPSRHDEGVLKSHGYPGKIVRLEARSVMPALGGGDIPVFVTGSGLVRALSVVCAENRRVFLASIDEASRQGFALLLSEWLHFLSRANPADVILLIRLGSSAFGPGRDAHQDAKVFLNDLTRATGRTDACVGFLGGGAEGDEFLAALRKVSAFVSASLGESFDVSASLAARHGIPTLLPDHTFYAELVTTAGSVRLPVRRTTVGLSGTGERYPLSSEWGLLRPRALSDALTLFAADA